MVCLVKTVLRPRAASISCSVKTWDAGWNSTSSDVQVVKVLTALLQSLLGPTHFATGFLQLEMASECA